MNYTKHGKIAGILLLVYILFSAITCFILYKGYHSLYFATEWIGWVLSCVIAVGLMTDKTTILKVSTIILLAYYGLNIFASLLMHGLLYFITACLIFIIQIFFVAALYRNGEKAKKLCFVMIVLTLLNMIFPPIYAFLHNTSPNMINSAISSLLVIAYYFLGLYLENKPKDNGTVNIPVDSKTTIEKMSALKTLLDKGAITQEDFDAKKKEIIER